MRDSTKTFMRGLILIGAMAWSIASSSTEWKKIAVAKDGAEFHVGIDTLQKNPFWANDSFLRKVWIIENFPNSKVVPSQKVYWILNCRDRLFHRDQRVLYGLPMGRGEGTNATNDDSRTMNVVPDTVAEDIWKFVCAM